MNRESSIVGFHHCVRNLRRRENRESKHHPIWVFFPDLRDQEGTHSRTCSSTQGMADLKTCTTTKHKVTTFPEENCIASRDNPQIPSKSHKSHFYTTPTQNPPHKKPQNVLTFAGKDTCPFPNRPENSSKQQQIRRRKPRHKSYRVYA
jgi:hypothetical protein